MSFLSCVPTHNGYVDIEPQVPLEHLEVGDRVLGQIDPADPEAPRTVYMVTAALGHHHVPAEDPGLLERILTAVGAERLVAGAKLEGVLLAGEHGLAMFALESDPAVDRVVS